MRQQMDVAVMNRETRADDGDELIKPNDAREHDGRNRARHGLGRDHARERAQLARLGAFRARR